MSPYRLPADKATYMREWAADRRQDLRELVEVWRAFYGYLCARCGKEDARSGDAAARFDWHHIDPASKSFEINDAINKRRHPREILDELLKCGYFCAKCHRAIHRAMDPWLGKVGNGAS